MVGNMLIDVRRAVALSAIFNFLWYCARGCLLPFLTLYLRQLGLSPVMIGIILGTKHLISLLWGPAAGLLSKFYNKRRVVICLSLVCSAAVALILQFIPPTDVHKQSSTCYVSNLSSGPAQSFDNLTTSSVALTTTQTITQPVAPRPPTTSPVKTTPDAKFAAAVTSERSEMSAHRRSGDESPPRLSQVTASAAVSNSPQGPTASSTTVPNVTSSSAAAVRNKRSDVKPGAENVQGEQAKEDESGFEFLGSLKAMDPQHQLFSLILIIVSVWEALTAPLEWTADDGVYEYLDFADASDRHGSIGLWGLLGAACGAGGAGLLVSRLSCHINGHTFRSAVHFYCYAVVALLALVVASCLPLYLNRKKDRAGGLLKAMQLVHSSPSALLCAVTTLLAAAAGSAVDNFLLWQMQDHGSNELHMGLSLALALLSQAAFPLLAARVSRVVSPQRLLVVAAASLAVQCLYYSFLWGPWAALLAQILSCFSSGALWWAVNAQCENVATPGAERSARRVYSSLTLYLGSSLGSFAGGPVVERFGVAWLFRGVALSLMVWCVCLPLLQWKAPRQRRINYSRLLAANVSEASDTDSEQERDWLDTAMKDERCNNNYGRRMN